MDYAKSGNTPDLAKPKKIKKVVHCYEVVSSGFVFNNTNYDDSNANTTSASHLAKILFESSADHTDK